MKKKVLIFVVCYHAEKSIESVLDRIPKEIWESTTFDTEILVIDDQSRDRTFHLAQDYAKRHPQWNLTVLYNPKNQGYGGNQKIGYHYAVKKGFDAVVLLHGDGQYAPEYLPQMIAPLMTGEADVVFGSRMMHRMDALKGHMPFYKWIGNQILTFMENKILKSNLAEFHTGYRAYSVPALAAVPFEHNSNYYDFDTDIIIQMLDTGKRIKEIPIPTFYGDEISRVNGTKYAVKIIWSCLLSRAIRLGIYYHPKFDYETSPEVRYQPKFGYASSHQFAYDEIKPGSTVINLGCDPGFMAANLSRKNVKPISIDEHINATVRQNSCKAVETDIDKYDFNDDFGKVDTILALDVIEHVNSPERLLEVLRQRFSRQAPDVIITTANVSFLPVRFDLFFGRFSYGNRGILDMDHKRLFTFSSLKRTLEINGYEILKIKGVPAPFPLALGNTWLAKFLLATNKALLHISKGMFSYQIFIIAKPLATVSHLLEDAHQTQKNLNEAMPAQK